MINPFDWTPATYAAACHGCVTLLIGLMLFSPSACGKKDGFYSAYYKKSASLYQKVATAVTDNLQALEIEMGTHFVCWGGAVLAALLPGEAVSCPIRRAASGQLMCIAEVAPMVVLAAVCLKADEKIYATLCCITALVMGYYGFVPFPVVKPVVWDVASYWLVAHCLLVSLATVPFLTGMTEAMYKAQPLVPTWCNSRERELILGATLLGLLGASVVAIATNVASDYCLLSTPAIFLSGVGHYLSVGDKQGLTTNTVFALIFLGFGLYPRVMGH